MPMQAAAAVGFEVGHDGSTVVARLRCAPPLVLCETSGGLMMVGAAGGPLGGDHWTLQVTGAPQTRARIGSVAATVAQRGRVRAESSFDVAVELAAEASLDWAPEPLVVADGAVHRSRIDIDVSPSSRLSWRDVVVLGRHASPPGRSITRWRVRRGGLPFFAHDLDIGAGAPDGWNGSAVLDGSRVIGSLLLVDPQLLSGELPADAATLTDVAVSTPLVRSENRTAATLFTLVGPGVLAVARGDTTVEVVAALDAVQLALHRGDLARV
jgi:urease accessory protein